MTELTPIQQIFLTILFAGIFLGIFLPYWSLTDLSQLSEIKYQLKEINETLKRLNK